MTLPTVTQVLSLFTDFSGIRPEVLAHAAERGTRVHRACAAIVQGLWIPSLDDEAAGYVRSFETWFPVVEEVVLSEEELVDPDLGFRGHPDLICRIKGDQRLTLIDFKTPVTKQPLWRAQLSAYRHLAHRESYDVERIASLRLKADGKRPILDEYTHAGGDLQAFLGALTAYRFFKEVA